MCTSKSPNVSSLGIYTYKNTHYTSVGTHQSVYWLGFNLDDRGSVVWILTEEKKFIFSETSRPTLRTIQPTNQYVRDVLCPGVRQPGRDADDSPPSNAEVKTCGTVPPTPVYLQEERRDNRDYTTRYKAFLNSVVSVLRQLVRALHCDTQNSIQQPPLSVI